MQRRRRAAAVLALCVLTGCTDAPLCRYWSDAPVSRSALDPSAVPMLPENPYWTSNVSSRSAAAARSGQDVCAGEPGHPARAAD
jgi:hypothetical protein